MNFIVDMNFFKFESPFSGFFPRERGGTEGGREEKRRKRRRKREVKGKETRMGGHLFTTIILIYL